MQGNGLTAAEYVALAVLDRSLAVDALLALRDAGVAAYAVVPDLDQHAHPPLLDDHDGHEGHDGTDEPLGPAGVTEVPDRATLFVDRTALERARLVVRELAPDAASPTRELSPVDEVAWQQIVSGFSATAPEPVLRPPSRRRDDPPAGQEAPPAQQRHSRAPEPVDDEEHFVPAPPPPTPRLDVVSRLAWGGVLGGPLALLAMALVSWAPPRALVLLCMLAFVGGMVVLVLRMRDRAPTDDGPDDGAVI